MLSTFVLNYIDKGCEQHICILSVCDRVLIYLFPKTLLFIIDVVDLIKQLSEIFYLFFDENVVTLTFGHVKNISCHQSLILFFCIVS